MKPLRPVASLALGVSTALLVTFASAAPTRADDVRTFEQVYTLDKADGARIEIGAGTLRIEPARDHKLRATVTLQCQHVDTGCARRAKNISLEGGYLGRQFVLKLEGLPKMNTRGLSANAVIQVPRELDVELVVGAGQVVVHDLEKDVRVDLGVGEVSVDMRDARVGSVAMDIGLGDARLRRRDHDIDSHGWLSKSVDWTGGAGPGRVHVHIGVGDAEVSLK